MSGLVSKSDDWCLGKTDVGERPCELLHIQKQGFEMVTWT
jgi:hypothetical protein